MNVVQKGFNYSQDGPGNRLVYHLQGCNMHCPWCANPESIALAGTWILKKNHTGVHKELSYKSFSGDELMDEIRRSKLLFFDGGGVTFTGGEPTLQFCELIDILKGCSNEGVHTAIETNGTSSRLIELLPYVDFLIMDFKHYDTRKLKSVTGVGNENIKKNIEMIADKGMQLLIRIPLISGFNATYEDIQGFLEFFKALDTNEISFEFLKYHEYGKEKWQQCNLEYIMKDAFVSEETLELFKTIFTQNGLKVIHT